MDAAIPEEFFLSRAVENLPSNLDQITSPSLATNAGLSHKELVDGHLKSLSARKAVRLKAVSYER